MQIAAPGFQREILYLHAGSGEQSKIWQDEQANFHMMDHGYPVVDVSTCRMYHSRRHFLPVIVEIKTVAQAGSRAPGPPLAPFAASYQTLSVVIQIDER